MALAHQGPAHNFYCQTIFCSQCTASTAQLQRVGVALLPSTPPPTPAPTPWHSRAMRKIQSPRSTTRVDRFHKVGEVAEDSAPDGALEWWQLDCDSGMSNES
jgi:hypothetical protein